jgi:tetratricopeptide (TPR) repeat protein
LHTKKNIQETRMAKWAMFPHTGEFKYTATTLKKAWPRLHAGDREPLPRSADVLTAWVLFHNGDFQRAAEAGLQAGGAGLTAANKATCIYANYLEPKEKTRLELFMEVAQRAEAQAQAHPENANAWYFQAYALGRYSQGISVAKALAEGLGTKVRKALEKTIQLCPEHADAHIALAAFHAEVIDKVGALIGGMTYGARKDTGLKLYRAALALNPTSAIAMMEYANGLVMLEGDKRMQEASGLYEQAAACQPLDATERLDVEMAKAELQD